MALVVAVTPAGAIATYSDLVAAIRDHLMDSAYSNDAIDRGIRFAEAHFNRELRTPEMESKIAVTIAGELTTLPDDFLSLRSLYEVGTPSFPLKSMSPSGLIYTYGQQSGTPLAYAIEGRQLRVAPVGSATLGMDYYARIPALTLGSPNNWLLTTHPGLYFHAVLMHCYQRDRDKGGEQSATGMALELLDSVKQSASRNRWGSGPLNPRGQIQVRNARA